MMETTFTDGAQPTLGKLAVIARLRRFKGLVSETNGAVIGTRGNRLIRFAPPYDKPEALATLPRGWRRRAGRLRLLHRLLRLEIYRMLQTPTGTKIATSREGILRCAADDRSLGVAFSAFQGRRPISLCRDGDGRLYFGEYFNNAERGPVSIFMSEDDGRTWRECHRFAAREIRHVHGLVYDRFRDRIWVMTGDYHDEAKIAVATPGFGEFRVVRQGSQMTRACDVICTPDAVFYATDTPLEQNHVFRLDPQSGETDSVAQVENSVLFMGEACGGMFLSTIVEPSTVNLTQSVHVWFSPDGHVWSQVFSAPRDSWSIRYFQYPTASFAAGPADCPVAFLSLRGVRKFDGDCLVVRPLPASNSPGMPRSTT